MLNTGPALLVRGRVCDTRLVQPIRTFFRRGVIAATLLAAAVASAADWLPKVLGWDGLQPNLTPPQVAMVLEPKVGRPVIVTKARGGTYETWNYDHGGCVVFVHGLLDYWSVPNPPESAPSRHAP